MKVGKLDQVSVDLDASTTVVSRSYWWPQEGLRVAHRGSADPTDSQTPTNTTIPRGRALDSAH
ncbi:hypothetical protein [Streptomyces sp. NPDC019890]|uniref:hypothetical protein n=1 Tax=Streptomyces sp. NPDC019890 TaxID=3365064 RepID=UPI00384F2D78